MTSNTVATVRDSNYFDPSWGCGTQPERLRKTLQYVSTEERILDFGCGAGAYTKTLNKLGYSAVGLDCVRFSEWSQDPEWFIQNGGNILPFGNDYFHTTISFEVIEHCPEPRQTLKEIHRCTNEYLVLSVPNCNLNNQLRRHDLALAHWTDPTHCNFFTKDIIRNLITESGFEILEIEDCYKIDPNSYYWNSIKLPKVLRLIGKKFFEVLELTETYYSSILVVARVNKE